MTRTEAIQLEIDALCDQRSRLLASFMRWARSTVARNFDRLKDLSDKIQPLREDLVYWQTN